MKSRTIIACIIFSLPIVGMEPDHAPTTTQTAAINALAGAATGLTVSVPLAISNKVVGKQSWQDAFNAWKKGTIPFMCSLGAAVAVQQVATQQVKEMLNRMNYDTENPAVSIAMQIPGALIGGYGSSLAELSLTNPGAYRKLIAERKWRMIMSAGGGAIPAMGRDAIFFMGVQGTSELEKLFSEYSDNKAVTNGVAVASSAAVSTVTSHWLNFIKARKQQELDPHLSMQRIIKQDGLKKVCTAGLFGRSIAVAAVYACMGPIQEQSKKIVLS